MQPRPLAPKAVVVIGGASGLGLLVAATALRRGLEVVVADASRPPLPVGHVPVSPDRPQDGAAALAAATSGWDRHQGVVVCSSFGTLDVHGLRLLVESVHEGRWPANPVVVPALAPDHHWDLTPRAAAAESAAIELLGIGCRTPDGRLLLHAPLGEISLDTGSWPEDGPVRPGQARPSEVAGAVLDTLVDPPAGPNTRYLGAAAAAVDA